VLVLKKNVHKPGHFQYTIQYEGKSFVHGHKKNLPQITCEIHLFEYVVNNKVVSAILQHLPMLRLLPKSYFKISTFRPNFLCFSSFKQIGNRYMTVSYWSKRKKVVIPIKFVHISVLEKNMCHKAWPQSVPLKGVVRHWVQRSILVRYFCLDRNFAMNKLVCWH